MMFNCFLYIFHYTRVLEINSSKTFLLLESDTTITQKDYNKISLLGDNPGSTPYAYRAIYPSDRFKYALIDDSGLTQNPTVPSIQFLPAGTKVNAGSRKYVLPSK
jgi:hypothetical protein